MQSHIALQLDGADNKVTRRNQHRAALVVVALVNSSLDRSSVQSDPVAFRAKLTHVIDASAEDLIVNCCCSRRLRPDACGAEQSRAQRSCNRRSGYLFEPFATR